MHVPTRNFISIAIDILTAESLVGGCERLISLAMQTGELSEEECGVISFYAQEIHPLSRKYPEQCDSSASSN